VSPGKKKGDRSGRRSLLTRLFGGGKKGDGKPRAKAGAGGSKAAGNGRAEAGPAAAKARPLTPLERSIREIKQLAKVGERDPERLALLLSNLLAGEKARRQQDQERFDRMVTDLLERRDAPSGPGD